MTNAYSLPEWELLLKAVATSPDDDLPRLVAADWLDEHGEPDRAEFIRSQCEYERWYDPHERAPRGEPLRKRIVELWAGPGPGHWFGGDLFVSLGETLHAIAGLHKPAGLVRRGFVSGLRVTVADYFARAADFFAAHPITKVVLSDAHIFPSGGNDTYYLGGLGMFPREYWRRLDGLPSRYAVAEAASAVCVAVGRELAGLPRLESTASALAP